VLCHFAYKPSTFQLPTLKLTLLSKMDLLSCETNHLVLEMSSLSLSVLKPMPMGHCTDMLMSNIADASTLPIRVSLISRDAIPMFKQPLTSQRGSTTYVKTATSWSGMRKKQAAVYTKMPRPWMKGRFLNGRWQLESRSVLQRVLGTAQERQSIR